MRNGRESSWGGSGWRTGLDRDARRARRRLKWRRCMGRSNVGHDSVGNSRPSGKLGVIIITNGRSKTHEERKSGTYGRWSGN
ncbi:unnamed protein product [Linum trigynum]